MPHPSTLNLTLALLCAAVLPVACDRAGPADAREAPHGEAHSTLPLGFEFLEPQHPAHPNWVDMGDIPIGEVREALVRMRNVEGRTITIESVQAGCSCTLPELTAILPSGERVSGAMRSGKAILTAPPDAIVELKLRVDSVQAPQKNKDKTVIVRITTDSDTTPYVTVEARMRIHAPLQPIPPDIHVARVGVHSGGEAHTDVTPMIPSGERVLGVLEAPEGVSVSIEPHFVSGIELWRVRARIEPPTPIGYHERWIKLRTSGPGGEGEGRPLAVKVRWTGAPDVEVAPARMLFLRSPADGAERATAELVTHMPGHRLLVTGHSLSGDGADTLRVSVTPLAPDEEGRAVRWEIALEPRGELQGTLNGVLRLELDDPQHPHLEVPYFRRS